MRRWRRTGRDRRGRRGAGTRLHPPTSRSRRAPGGAGSGPVLAAVPEPSPELRGSHADRAAVAMNGVVGPLELVAPSGHQTVAARDGGGRPGGAGADGDRAGRRARRGGARPARGAEWRPQWSVATAPVTRSRCGLAFDTLSAAHGGVFLIDRAAPSAGDSPPPEPGGGFLPRWCSAGCAAGGGVALRGGHGVIERRYGRCQRRKPDPAVFPVGGRPG